MQTILYSTITAMRNYVYRDRINHTVYSAKEFELNYYPIRKHLNTLATHDLIIVSGNLDWVKHCIKLFKLYHVQYRLINDGKASNFKPAMQTINLKKPFELLPLVYYEQFIKPVIYIGLTRQAKTRLMYDAKRENAVIVYIRGTGFTDINRIPLLSKVTTQYIQLKLSIILPCDNPASFLDDATNKLCLLADPNSPNPLTRVYDLRTQKWFKPKFNQGKIKLPLVKFNANELRTEFDSGRYTIYAVEIGDL